MSKAPSHNQDTHVLYEISVKSLKWEFDNGQVYDVSHLLENGRANYILMEDLIAQFSGLAPNSQGGKSDLRDDAKMNFEVKSYPDVELHPEANDWFHTASSSTFGANNHGPAVKQLLKSGDYPGALKLCKEKGYDKNDFYVYVNSAQFRIDIPIRYIILPKKEVLGLLSSDDPRLISRREILSLATHTVQLDAVGLD
jgi:hypothetical protein